MTARETLSPEVWEEIFTSVVMGSSGKYLRSHNDAMREKTRNMQCEILKIETLEKIESLQSELEKLNAPEWVIGTEEYFKKTEFLREQISNSKLDFALFELDCSVNQNSQGSRAKDWRRVAEILIREKYFPTKKMRSDFFLDPKRALFFDDVKEELKRRSLKRHSVDGIHSAYKHWMTSLKNRPNQRDAVIRTCLHLEQSLNLLRTHTIKTRVSEGHRRLKKS